MYSYCEDIEKAFQYLANKSNIFFKIIDMREYMSYLHKGLHFTSAVLSENEHLKFKGFKYPKKKLQWLCGRIASKEALKGYLNVPNAVFDFKNIEVLYGEGGYPFIKNFENLNLTISHSFPYCAAVLSDKPVGVDIEKIFEPSSSIIKYYFTDNEAKLLEAADLSEQKRLGSCIWSRKEALSKLMKKGMSVNFKEIDAGNDEVVIMNRKIFINSVIINEYCVSMVVGDEE